eukprot:scaffold138503_cov34-Attheya_sp.AAC.4
MSRCISPDTDKFKHENNDYDMQSNMQSSSSSSGDSQNVSNDERNEDAKETSSSEDYNYEQGHESDTSVSIEESLSSTSLLTSNSMFSFDYQSSLTDDSSLMSGGDKEDIDIDEEEDEDMLDNLPPPIDLVEARLLELMMKYSVPLGSYKSFLEWAKLSVNTKYNFDSLKKTFGANIKRLLNHDSQARNQPTEIIFPGRGQLPDVSVYTFPFLENAKYMYSKENLMANSLWKYDASSKVYGESNTGRWWKEA